MTTRTTRTARTQLSQTPDAGAPNGATWQFRQFHAMLRGGQIPDEAGAELGVDPLVARLWALLPANHFKHPAVAWDPPPESATPDGNVPVARRSDVPWLGVSRLLFVHVPAGITRTDTTLEDALSGELTPAALSNAVASAKRGGYAGNAWFFRLPSEVVVSIQASADAAGVPACLVAGHLVASRLDWPIVHARTSTAPKPSMAPAPRMPLLTPGRRREIARRTKTPAQAPDDTAPTGAELASRRHELKISQRDLAGATGLSRGLIAEVERGRRQHVGTRQKIADTLDRLSKTPLDRIPVPTPHHLTDEQATQMRAEWAASGVRDADLAVRYGVSISSVYKCITRRTHKDVE